MILFIGMPCLQSDSKEHLVDHLRSQNHEKNLNFFISDMAIYCHYCETCKMLLLGNHAMLNQHFNSKYHTNEYFRLSGERIIPTSGVVNVNILIVRGIFINLITYRLVIVRNYSEFIKLLLLLLLVVIVIVNYLNSTRLNFLYHIIRFKIESIPRVKGFVM